MSEDRAGGIGTNTFYAVPEPQLSKFPGPASLSAVILHSVLASVQRQNRLNSLTLQKELSIIQRCPHVASAPDAINQSHQATMRPPIAEETESR